MTAATRSSTSPDLLLGRTVGTHYVVQQLLGRGRRSVTYQAEHRTLHSRVVVKLLDVSWGGDGDAVSRFESAARSLSTMEAPNVAAVIDFGRESGRGVFVVNEYVDGESLEKFLARMGPLPVEVFVPIAAQVLKGMGAAHTRGLFHLDLKPANVMICRDGDRGLVKLLDLGLVQLFEGHVNEAEAPVVGDPAYQAPEQITQRPLDARTDVYAIGCLFYRMLGGRAPFTGTDAQILYNHVNDEPPELADVLPAESSVPEDLLELIRDCIHKDPDARPVDANEIVERLIDAVPAVLFRLPVPAPGAEIATRLVAPSLASLSASPPTPSPSTPPPAPPRRPTPVPDALTTSVDEPADESSSMRRVAPVIGSLSISEPSAGRSGWDLKSDAGEGGEASAKEPAKGGGGGIAVVLVLLVLGGLAAIYFLRPELLGMVPTEPTPPTKTASATPPTVEAGADEVKSLLAAAQASERAGEVDAALAGYQKVIARDPGNAAAKSAIAALEAAKSAGTPVAVADSAAAVADSAAAASAGAGESAGAAAAGGESAGAGGESAGAAAGGESAGAGGESAGAGGESAGAGGESAGAGGESAGAAGETGGAAVDPTAGATPAVAEVAVEFKVSTAGKVFVDGKEVGPVPGIVSLAAGERTVRIEAKGHAPWEQKMKVSEGMKPVKVTLKKKRAPGDPVNFDFDEDAGVPATVPLKK